MTPSEYHTKMHTLVELNRVPGLTWADKLAYLGYALQNDETCPIEHIFEKGWYIREITIPAERVFIGRPHTHGHICKLIRGKVMHITEEFRRILEAPFTLVSTAGYQVVIYTYTEVVGRTYHPNPEELRDTEALEAQIFVPRDTLLAHGKSVEWLLSAHERTDDLIEFPSPVGVSVAESAISGKGLIAGQEFTPGSVIAPASLGGKRTPAGRYTNHSLSPNATVRREGNDFYFLANQHIAPGTEVTIDYRQVAELA
jgi:hypothetical protein